MAFKRKPHFKEKDVLGYGEIGKTRSIKKTYVTRGWLTEFSEVNLKDTDGMPEKARKGYAALSNFRGSNLGNKQDELAWAVLGEDL